MRKSLLAAAISCLSLLCCNAKADTFNFSATALGVSISGVLTATNNNDQFGSYTVTGITGAGITGLVAANDPFFGNDNLLFPTNTRTLDVNGLAFTQLIGGQLYSLDLYSAQSGFLVLALDSRDNISFNTATFNVSSTSVTPEPSSLILLGTGLLGTAATLRRRIS